MIIVKTIDLFLLYVQLLWDEMTGVKVDLVVLLFAGGGLTFIVYIQGWDRFLQLIRLLMESVIHCMVAAWSSLYVVNNIPEHRSDSTKGAYGG